jgi:hypothetical protein
MVLSSLQGYGVTRLGDRNVSDGHEITRLGNVNVSHSHSHIAIIQGRPIHDRKYDHSDRTNLIPNLAEYLPEFGLELGVESGHAAQKTARV